MEEQEKIQIVNDYLINYNTVQELATKYHRGQDSIYNVLKEKHIKLRTSRETIILKKNPGMTYQQVVDGIIDNYVNKKMGQKKSGEPYGVAVATVQKILEENNISTRNLHDSIVLSNQINARNIVYSKDEEFFSKESSNMAWLLGFLASDGNVAKRDNRIRIELSYIDEEILMRIKETVKIENPLSFREDKKGRKLVILGWNCKQHKEDLAKYSIVPNKTNILAPPYLLSHKYYLDYIRGYFDGDGTININMCHQGRSKAIRFGICGASEPMLEWIVDVFEEYGIPRVNLHRDSSHEKPFWSIVYSTCASRKIYKLLYGNLKEDSLYLQRKKDKYERILKEVPEKE